MSPFQLEIVTPTKLLDEGQVEYVRCPGLDGSFGVMAYHREAIIALGVGEIKVTQNGKDHFLATSGGFAEITREKVELLLETYERTEEIDTSRA
jgi:F-type H+-transporting ATPase subunit epsilon